MIKRLLLLVAIATVLACGGGGGGGAGTPAASTAAGRIVWAETGAAPVPAATVQIGSTSTSTDLVDGAFTLTAPTGSTSLTAIYRSAPGAVPVTFVFSIPPLSGTTSIGDLWIGPQRVRVQGMLANAADSSPVAGAKVSFAGRTGTSLASGAFALEEVAYPLTNVAAFLGIEGRIDSSAFFARTFSPLGEAVGGVVDVGTLNLTPTSEATPPPAPFNLWGVVTPLNQSNGTVVTLLEAGAAIRQFTVGADGRYQFWVGAGSYTLRFNNPGNGKTSPDQNVTFATADQVIRRDAVLL